MIKNDCLALQHHPNLETTIKEINKIRIALLNSMCVHFYGIAKQLMLHRIRR